MARLLPPALDSAGIAWTLKTPALTGALARPDAAVCYVRDEDRAGALPLLAATMAGALAPGRAVPFTAPHSPGVSWAEDPGGEESFGQVCCGLLAQAFLRGGAPVEAAAQAFTRAGCDPAQPHTRSTT